MSVRFNAGGIQTFQYNPIHVITDKTGTLTTGQLELANIISAENGLPYDEYNMELKTGMSVCLEGDPMENKIRDILNVMATDSNIVYRRRFNRDIGCKLSISNVQEYKLHLQGIPETLTRYCGVDTVKLDELYHTRTPLNTYIRIIAYCTGHITQDQYDSILADDFSSITEHKIPMELYYYVFYDYLVSGLKTSIESVHRLCNTITLLTGDSIASARAVAESIGMLHSGTYLISGHDFELMSQGFDEKLDEKILSAKDIIIYRASPHIKQLYVSYMQRNDVSVMMIGDGPNDVSAIMQADVGVGVIGESVTVQHVSDIVIDSWNKIPKLLQSFRVKQHIIYAVIQWVMLKHILTGCTLLSMLLISFYTNIKDPASPYIMAIFNGATCLVMILYTYTENPVYHSSNPYKLMLKGCLTGVLLGAWMYVTDAEAIYIAITTQFCILLVKMYLMTSRLYYLLIDVLILSFISLVSSEPYVYVVTAIVGCISYYIIDS